MISRTILVTGASKGLGYAAADRLAQQGHQIIGLARNLPKEPFPGKFVTIDLADSVQTESVLADLTAEYSALLN
jgi:3-oxoacyl-[acyl-carrier protein] reductase